MTGGPLILAACAVLMVEGESQQREQKSPVPDSASRKSTLSEIRQLFKDDYARRDPVSRRALALRLFDQGVRSRADAASCFVMLTEGRTLASEAGAIALAFRAIDKLAEFFDLKKDKTVATPVEMKLDVLSKATRIARDPNKIRPIAKGYLSIAREAATAGDFKVAQDASKKASTLARKARAKELVEETSDFSKGITELKREFAAASKVDLTQAIDIGDKKSNLSVGRYLCFAKEEWDRGLEYLVWSGIKDLAEVAKKELAQPQESAAQAAVGDDWYALAGKERVSIHKKRYQSRARTWYQKALGGAVGVVKLRIEKRLDELEPALPGAVDLLRMISPARHAVVGEWKLEGRSLTNVPKPGGVRLQIPYEPPAEYDLVLELERKSGAEISVGLVIAGRQCVITIAPNLGVAGIVQLDRKDYRNNESTFRGLVIPTGKRVTLVYSIRRKSVAVTYDGKRTVDWKGEESRIGFNRIFTVPNPRALFVGSAMDAGLIFHKLQLIQITGTGKRLR